MMEWIEKNVMKILRALFKGHNPVTEKRFQQVCCYLHVYPANSS